MRYQDYTTCFTPKMLPLMTIIYKVHTANDGGYIPVCSWSRTISTKVSGCAVQASPPRNSSPGLPSSPPPFSLLQSTLITGPSNIPPRTSSISLFLCDLSFASQDPSSLWPLALSHFSNTCTNHVTIPFGCYITSLLLEFRVPRGQEPCRVLSSEESTALFITYSVKI